MEQKVFLDQVYECQLNIIKKYSEGVLQEMLLKHYQERGKMIRPLFAHSISQSFQKETKHIIEWSAACEMLHNATLIHDDLQDGDKTRRGQAASWVLYGENQAINAGDFLLTLAPKIFLESSLDANKKVELAQVFSESASRIVQGQSIEFTLQRHLQENNLKDLYYKCIELKTSVLFTCISKGVCIIQDLDKSKELENIFKSLGTIFQIQDDLLDLYGTKRRDQHGCDIREGKISHLVTTYLNLNPKDEFQILPIIQKARNNTTDHDVNYVIEAFDKSGTKLEAVEELIGLIHEIKNDTEKIKIESFKTLTFKTLQKILEPIKHLMNGETHELHA